MSLIGPVCCIEVRREGGPLPEMCSDAEGSRAGMLTSYLFFCLGSSFP